MANSYKYGRIISDIKDIYHDSLTDNGIHYVHDDTDMFKGYAMIIGPKESVYRDGFYFFKFIFPENYPHSPPKIVFEIDNTNVRYHPNLYSNGKVCLSIINTWDGEGWTSCQTIKSVLLTILSIMDSNPLIHEPGICSSYSHFDNYNKMIRFKNIEISLLNVFNHKRYSRFEKEIKDYILDNKREIKQYVEGEYLKEPIIHFIECELYNMFLKIDWDNNLQGIISMYHNLR